MPVASPGYKIVNVKSGGNTIPIQVKEQGDPFKNVKPNGTVGKYDPSRVFSATSSMADKKFTPSSNSFANQSFHLNSDESKFATKSYQDNATFAPAGAKNSYGTANGAFDKPAAESDRSFNVAKAGDTAAYPVGQFSGARAMAAEQNREAALGGPDRPETYGASTLASKQYLGPGAQRVPDNIVVKDNIVLSRMSGLPNRSLSIDEVRNLINHESKPDTDAPAAEPSKPLNDPNHIPEPLRDDPMPSATPHSNSPSTKLDDDKDDPVPSPGTIAAPESAEPLPQR